nr:MAG TPA: hypothetical protein [Caudoviricetes sp.]
MVLLCVHPVYKEGIIYGMEIHKNTDKEDKNNEENRRSN